MCTGNPMSDAIYYSLDDMPVSSIENNTMYDSSEFTAHDEDVFITGLVILLLMIFAVFVFILIRYIKKGKEDV